MQPDSEAQANGELVRLLSEVKRVAKCYYDLTGRPLGVTGEVAEYEAIRLLGLEPAVVRQAGYDAVRRTTSECTRLQIKGRCLQGKVQPGDHTPDINPAREWDAALLVLLDRDLEATAIFEADRPAIVAVIDPLHENEAGKMPIRKFKGIGKQVWPATVASGA